MSSATLTTLSEPAKISLPNIPEKAVPHGFDGKAEAPIELGPFPNIVARNGHAAEASPTGQSDSERCRSPPAGSVVEQMQTIWNPYKNRFRVLGCCFTGFANGMNDSAPGALLASIERDYNINYGTVSTIFVCNALGFIAAAFFVSSLTQRFGRAKALILSETLLIIGYTIIACTPPFPVVTISFFITGVGMGVNLAISQVFCANLANNTAMVGFYQGSYGIGGTIAPLIATAMLSRGYIWSRFYLIELGFAVFNLFFSPWAFWKYEIESEQSLPMPANGQNQVQTKRSEKRRWESFKTIMSNKPTILGACFTFAYQGAEVAISGWIISFLVQIRHGDPSKVGYVTSGFWAGITVGRFTLSFLAHRVGERLSVFLFAFGALLLELLIWFVPSIPGDSVAVAISGFLLGPVSPCSIHLYQRLIPRKMQISSLSLIGSVGSSGGAIAPFMTGMIAQSAGTWVLHPICIGLFVAMGVSWWALPEPEKRAE
ncbi:major facilitator superfamily domain-containing protein [Halenospora varia]|nr:major facilitator superfamily domain-containing protein [Halenospora varia]